MATRKKAENISAVKVDTVEKDNKVISAKVDDTKKNEKIVLDNNLLSVDLGYSAVKYYFVFNGKEHFGKIPNAVKKVDSKQDTLEFKDAYYRVGDDAVDFDVELSLEAKDLIANAPLFIHAILEKEKINDENLVLVTGLSIKDFDIYDEELIKNISNFTINGIEHNYEVVKILPQGRGLAYDFYEKKETPDIVLIFDIGYNTFDFIVLQDGKTKVDYSFANDYGINKLINNFQARLQNDFGIERTTAELVKILNKKEVKSHGEVIDCSSLIDDCLVDYLKDMKNWCLKRKASASLLERADSLLFGGGGAYYLKLTDKEKIKNIFGRSQLEFVDEPYEFSNTRGYYKRILELL